MVRNVPVDLSDVVVEAIMPDGAIVAGEGQENGQFEIEGVPQGDYVLRIGPRYIATGARRFDLSVSTLGREGIGRINEHTLTTLSISGLTPWADGHTVELFSPSGGYSYIDALGALSSDPSIGATSYTGQFDAFLGQSTGEASSDLGDVLYATQVGARLSGANEIREVLAGASVDDGVELLSGQVSTISATLAPVSQTRTLNVVWNSDAYQEAMTAVGPSDPSSITTQLRLVATPTDPTYGLVTAFPTLAAATIVETGEVALQARFDSPFPSHWEEIEIDELAAVVELSPEDGDIVVRAGATSFAGRFEAGASPVVGPVGELTIDGQDATAALTAVGESPVVAWATPEIGTTDGYEVSVISLDGAGGPIAVLYTTETSIAIPAGLLESGKSSNNRYAVLVRSRSMPGVDLTLEPFAQTVPSAFAEFVSAPFSP